IRSRRPAAELDGETLAGGAEPEAAALLREHVNEVIQDLNALPPRARQALWLREVLGLGYEEIARVLDVREGAARQAVAEARAAVRADRSARRGLRGRPRGPDARGRAPAPRPDGPRAHARLRRLPRLARRAAHGAGAAGGAAGAGA